jgi:hypothetical protein
MSQRVPFGRMRVIICKFRDDDTWSRPIHSITSDARPSREIFKTARDNAEIVSRRLTDWDNTAPRMALVRGAASLLPLLPLRQSTETSHVLAGR